MTRNRIVARAVLTAGVAVAASLAMALPAQAHGGGYRQDVTCDGTLGAQTVGNVVVADGAGCVLENTTVKGSIKVGAGAALDMTGVEVYRGVTATGSGRITATDTVVVGAFTSTNVGIVRLTGTGVLGNVAVQGDTSFNATTLAVSGNLSGTTVNRFDVADSYVLGTLSAFDAYSGANFCGNWVYGDTKITNGGGALVLGSAAGCAGNEVNGDVVVQDNFAYVGIDGNTVKGDLNCTGNDPAPVVGTNTVKGAKLGQCA